MTQEDIEKAADEFYKRVGLRIYQEDVDFAVQMVRRHNEELQEKLKFMSCTCSKVIREAKP